MPPSADQVVSFAIDRSARQYDADGRLHVAINHISKANICGYYGREIPNREALGLDPDRMYQLWRHPDELSAAVSTANNIPLLDTHIIVSPGDPVQESVVGSTGTDAAFDAPYLNNSLVIWTDWAIQGVEKREQCELSCAYRYRADMTPGEHDGQKFDGVMREIVFNHVALVPEGRAGPDVVVGDSLEIAPMSLSRKALMASGAVRLALRPVLATDAKVDVDAMFAGVTAKNFTAMKGTVASRLERATKGKLKAGSALDAAVAAIDAMEEEACDDEPDEEEKKKAEDGMRRARDKRAKDRKASMDRMRAADGESEESAEERKDREAEDEAEDARRAKDGEAEESMDECARRYGDKRAKDKKARDEKGHPTVGGGMDAKAFESMIKAAVDAAVVKTRDSVVGDMNAISAARRDVAPIIGEVGEVGSARELYAMALDSADVKLDGSESLSALRSMVKLLPTPDSVPAPRGEFALDAAAHQGFAQRFPTASRLGQA